MEFYVKSTGVDTFYKCSATARKSTKGHTILRITDLEEISKSRYYRADEGNRFVVDWSRLYVGMDVHELGNAAMFRALGLPCKYPFTPLAPEEAATARAQSDYAKGITRDETGRALAIEAVDRWYNSNDPFEMLIYRLGDKLYCAYGWQGDSYSSSFRVLDRFTAAPDEQTVELIPIYRHEDEQRIAAVIDEDDNAAFEIIGFNVRDH